MELVNCSFSKCIMQSWFALKISIKFHKIVKHQNPLTDNYASAATLVTENKNDKIYIHNNDNGDNGNLFNSRINFLSAIIDDARAKLSDGVYIDMHTEIEKKLLDNIVVDLRALREFFEKTKGLAVQYKNNKGQDEKFAESNSLEDELIENKRSIIGALMKTRRSHRKPPPALVDEKEFSPSISIGEFGT